jgi:hypothetical protein
MNRILLLFLSLICFFLISTGLYWMFFMNGKPEDIKYGTLAASGGAFFERQRSYSSFLPV